MIHESDGTERMSWSEMVKCASGTEADRKNQYRMLGWMAAWGVSYIGGTAILRLDDLSSAVQWGTPVLALILAVATLVAYLKFLREADELTRKIQMDGMAVGCGMAVVVTLGYQMFEWAGAPALSMNTVATVILVSVSAGQLNAMRRYR